MAHDWQKQAAVVWGQLQWVPLVAAIESTVAPVRMSTGMAGMHAHHQTTAVIQVQGATTHTNQLRALSDHLPFLACLCSPAPLVCARDHRSATMNTSAPTQTAGGGCIPPLRASTSPGAA